MTIEVRCVASGAPARAALAQAVAQTKGHDPFAPVTVVVPTNLAALGVRRALGGSSGGRGVVAVDVVTPNGLAASLVPDAATPFVSSTALLAAVRAVLDDDAASGGYFAAVAGHPATAEAIAALHAELRRLPDSSLAQLARSPSARTRAVVQLHHAVRRRLAGRRDECDVVRDAIAALERGADVSALGTVLVHLHDELDPLVRDLLAALGSRTQVVVIQPCTGVAALDEPVLDQLRALAPAHGPAIEPPHAQSVISASDSDDEVRSVVREVLARAEAGVPLARIGIFYPLDDPYARIVREQLAGAGIAHSGPSVLRLGDTLVGRTLRRVLALVESGLGRGEIIDLVSTAPVRQPGGAPVPATAWDALSRRAGVVGGLDDWHRKLASYRALLRELAESPDASEAALRHAERQTRQADELERFVDWLAAQLDKLGSAATWRDHATHVRRLLTELLGPLPSRDLPEAEQRAARRVVELLDTIGGLDAIDPRPSTARVVDVVEAELDVPAARVGRFGDGVVFGPLSHAAGLDLDVVFVVGMAEDLCPATLHDDSLLPDDERRRVPGLRARADSTTRQHRQLLHALAAGAQRVLSVPRGDHRSGRTRLPSRWALDAVARLSDVARLGVADFERVAHPAVRHVASYVSGVRDDTAAPVDRVERDLRVLTAWHEAGHDVRRHPLASRAVVSGIDAVLARRSVAFTPWDGNLAKRGVPSPASGQVLSASRLETWVACPFRYFLAHVLRLEQVAAPESILSIGALDRGSLVHAVLERFFADVVAKPASERPAPTRAWSAADRERLLALADELFAEYESRGVTGRAVLWQVQRERIRDDLRRFLEADTELRASESSTPEAVELAFGLDGAEPAVVQLDDGRRLAFRGRIDRVDRRSDGTLLVLDYKTGKPSRYRDLVDDPVAGGQRLQLPLYAIAAEQRVGGTGAKAGYWFTTAEGTFDIVGYEVDDTVRRRFRDVLRDIVDGIEAGVFVPNPGAYNTYFRTHENCRYCDFDTVCPRDRGDHWRATATAVELEGYRRLIGDVDDADTDDELKADGS